MEKLSSKTIMDIDNKIISAIDNSMFNLSERFNNKLPLEILGRVVKDLLYIENFYIIIDKKRISPNKYIKKRYKSLSKFINLKTNYNLNEISNNIFLSI